MWRDPLFNDHFSVYYARLEVENIDMCSFKDGRHDKCHCYPRSLHSYPIDTTANSTQKVRTAEEKKGNKLRNVMTHQYNCVWSRQPGSQQHIKDQRNLAQQMAHHHLMPVRVVDISGIWPAAPQLQVST